jgi:hypothetical protein
VAVFDLGAATGSGPHIETIRLTNVGFGCWCNCRVRSREKESRSRIRNTHSPRAQQVSDIDLISCLVVGMRGGEILKARKPTASKVEMTSSRSASSPHIVTGFPDASSIIIDIWA